jgi:tRNA(Arg) A34 adenosine deaminase TadA
MALMRFGLLLAVVAFGAYTQHNAFKKVRSRNAAEMETHKLQLNINDLDLDFLRQAVAITKRPQHHDGIAEGCVIVMNGKIIGDGVNETGLRNDASAHAVVNAVREACTSISSPDIAGSVAYTTSRPCAMCLSLLHFAGVTELYYRESTENLQHEGVSKAGYAGISLNEGISPIKAVPVPEARLSLHK